MRIVLCGDLLFSSRNLARRLDPRVVKLLTEADAVFANAEFSTPRRTTPPGLCMYLTSVSPDTLQELADLNIRLVSFANNHTVDFGTQGVIDTLEAAERYGLQPCGIGYNLEDARRARFLDADDGRVAVVACNSTWCERMLASNANADVVARPGQAPLRWGLSYVLPDNLYQQMLAINTALGTEASMAEVSRVETWEPHGPDSFKFGSPMSGNLLIERGESPQVRTWLNDEDEAALLKSIADAAQRSDAVIATFHSHEGVNENWYADEPPAFIVQYAHDCIDAGADVVVGQGAHFARGVEVYDGKPIFYNLGSLLMEFEAGESMISPEMYANYHLPPDARPMDLHGPRAHKADGSWNGFYAERKCSENLMVVMDVAVHQNGVAPDIAYTVVPIDLDMTRPNNLRRGLPEIMASDAAESFARRLENASAQWGTRLEYDSNKGTISVNGIV